MDHDHDQNQSDGFFEPLGMQHPGDMISPLDPPWHPDYYDGPLLAFLTREMREATTRFLHRARSKGHRIQPLPATMIEPHPVKQRHGHKNEVILSREAIRIVYISQGGHTLPPSHVPFKEWNEVAAIGKESGLAPGLFAPHGDRAFFALNKTKKHEKEEEPEWEKDWLTVSKATESLVFKIAFKAADWGRDAWMDIAKDQVKELTEHLEKKALAQLVKQAKYLISKQVPAGEVRRWYVSAKQQMLHELKGQDRKALAKEIERIARSKKAENALTKGTQDAQGLDDTFESDMKSLTEDVDKGAQALGSAEKLTGVLKITGWTMLAVDIGIEVNGVVVKCVEHPREWPHIAVEEGLKTAAGIGGGLLGASVGAEVGAEAGAAIGAAAAGIGAIPCAAIGALIGGVLGLVTSKAAEYDMENLEQTKWGKRAIDSLSREIERHFPPRDTHFNVKNEAGRELMK